MTQTLTLYRHLCDNALEINEKIGYTRAALHINYPPHTLASLLGRREMTQEETEAALDRFIATHRDILGDIAWRYRPADGIYMLTLPAEGVAYIHEHEVCPPFTRALIALTLTPFTGRKEVHTLFDTYAGTDGYTVTEAPDSDFDEAIRFRTTGGACESERLYVYCLEYDEERMEYHRLLPEDYADIYGV